MSSMNPVSAGGFSSAAGHYARARPAYAREAIGLIGEVVAGGAVLDLGAGTGILTSQLRRSGREVHACEPLPEMVAHLRRALPDVPAVVGTAEDLPLRRDRYSGVTIAQAFHWMDPARALPEVERVLVPGGVLAMLWNVRDESVGWVGELTDLIESRSGGRPYSDHREHRWSDVVAAVGGFSHVGSHRWSNPVQTTPAGLLERVRSTSFVAVLDEPERKAIEDEVRALLEASPQLAGRDRFEYPYHTVVELWRAGHSGDFGHSPGPDDPN